MLRTLGPDSAFERGFSITMNARGKVIKSINDIGKGEQMITKLKDGELISNENSATE
jgi:exodeoxyribonuclease VII large subunit